MHLGSIGALMLVPARLEPPSVRAGRDLSAGARGDRHILVRSFWSIKIRLVAGTVRPSARDSHEARGPLRWKSRAPSRISASAPLPPRSRRPAPRRRNRTA
jgi:hypothetical protein